MNIVMNQKSTLAEMLKSAIEVTQLGLSVVVPVVLCAFLGVYLQKRFGLPQYTVAIFILLGLGAGIRSFVVFVKRYLKRIEREQLLEREKHKEDEWKS